MFLRGSRLVPLLITALVGACSCSPGNDTVVIRHGTQTCEIGQLEQELALPGYDHLRADPQRMVETALRNLVLRLHLSREPANEQERRVMEVLSRRRQSEQCAAMLLKRRYLDERDPEADARAYFEAHRSELGVVETFRLQMIFIPEDEPGAGRLVAGLLEQIRSNPDDFGLLAEQHSRSQTAANQGMTPVMAGNAVHPELRKQVAAHRESEEPFLVHIDRGFYLVRVLAFLEGDEADFESVKAQAMTGARREYFESVYEEAVARVAETHPSQVQQHLFVTPRIESDEEVYRVGEELFTVSDLLPGWQPGDPLSGPMLRQAWQGHQRWYSSSLRLGCLESSEPAFTAEALASRRLTRSLVEFASAHLESDLEEYLALHQEALRRPIRFSLDLYIMPFRSRDRYHDLAFYRPAITALQEGDADVGWLVDQGVQVLERIELNEAELLGYDPALIMSVTRLELGRLSDYLISDPVRAFLMVRVHTRGERQPLQLADPGDRARVAARFVADNHELVMEQLYAQISDEYEINRGLAEQVAAESGGNTRTE